MVDCTIKKITGRQIIDSRGIPTVEAVVMLENGIAAAASVPSGASTGSYEAYELRDDDERFGGKGVCSAVGIINKEISDMLSGIKADRQETVDYLMIKEDGTDNKSHFGANSILAVSLACAKASAKAYSLPFYRYIGGINARVLPVPMLNIINGGAHASNNLDIQEFMIVPYGAGSFTVAVRIACEIYAALKKILKSRGLSVSVGDEGGFAPALGNDEEALSLICDAAESAGYLPGKDIYLALDIASSEWIKKGDTTGRYYLPKRKQYYTSSELFEYYKRMTEHYPIISIEDPFSENDWTSFTEFTQKNRKLQIVGDDLFVTNKNRLQTGIKSKAANAILIKPNQIGTLTETAEAVALAKSAGYNTIISHRSGETEDVSVADIAVGLNAGQIKTGAPARSERTAKYNRLMRIEASLGKAAVYAAGNCTNIH